MRHGHGGFFGALSSMRRARGGGRGFAPARHGWGALTRLRGDEDGVLTPSFSRRPAPAHTGAPMNPGPDGTIDPFARGGTVKASDLAARNIKGTFRVFTDGKLAHAVVQFGRDGGRVVTFHATEPIAAYTDAISAEDVIMRAVDKVSGDEGDEGEGDDEIADQLIEAAAADAAIHAAKRGAERGAMTRLRSSAPHLFSTGMAAALAGADPLCGDEILGFGLRSIGRGFKKVGRGIGHGLDVATHPVREIGRAGWEGARAAGSAAGIVADLAHGGRRIVGGVGSGVRALSRIGEKKKGGGGGGGGGGEESPAEDEQQDTGAPDDGGGQDETAQGDHSMSEIINGGASRSRGNEGRRDVAMAAWRAIRSGDPDAIRSGRALARAARSGHRGAIEAQTAIRGAAREEMRDAVASAPGEVVEGWSTPWGRRGATRAATTAAASTPTGAAARKGWAFFSRGGGGARSRVNPAIFSSAFGAYNRGI